MSNEDEQRTPQDERRGAFRTNVPACLSVDVPLAFLHNAVSSEEATLAQWQWDELAITPDMVKAMVAERDLAMRDPLLVQLLTRIDWMLTTVLKTLGKVGGNGQTLPHFTTVNLSASGIRFLTEHEYAVGTMLMLRLILRPFVPIQAIGRVVRIRAKKMGQMLQYETAAEFTQIAEDDQEAIIRHLLRAQALTQRLRQQATAPCGE
ncbi:MAG: PilZ domain-containing protein [Nitrospirae bacterium]|nr:MAG: PilZ domain-containing protein [Nitrospirota bacterium]